MPEEMPSSHPARRFPEGLSEEKPMTDQPADSTLTTKQKLKISWFSNAPWANTGYGVQTKLNVPAIKSLGYEVAVTAFFGLQGGMTRMNDGTTIYPAAKHPYGQDIIGAHAVHFGANALITLMDAWVVQPDNIAGLAWFPWFPVDCEPMPAPVVKEVLKATKGITMSKFGRDMAEKAGLDVYYVPHCVDTKVFKPIDRNEARARLGLPKDKFIIGMVAANKGIPPRKSFFEQIAGFAVLHKEKPDTLLYLHTDDGMQGGETVNLVEYCQLFGLKVGYVDTMPLDPTVDVAFVDQYQNVLGISDIYMVDVYNALDVLLMASMGEGFGIPLIEAQACGCPVITGDWTSMGELCFSGWKIRKDEAIMTYHPFFKAFQWRVLEGAVADRLFKAYEVRNNQDYRKRARDGAMAYDVDKVKEKYWKPVLADIEAHLENK